MSIRNLLIDKRFLWFMIVLIKGSQRTGLAAGLIEICDL